MISLRGKSLLGSDCRTLNDAKKLCRETAYDDNRLLRAQTHIRRHGPADVRQMELVTLEELQEIRRIWVVEKHEFEDAMPAIYLECTGTDYPGRPLDDSQPLGADDLAVLREHCGEDRLHYEMVRELLDVERISAPSLGPSLVNTPSYTTARSVARKCNLVSLPPDAPPRLNTSIFPLLLVRS